MRRKVMSIFICAMMILSTSISITQNVGESENVVQPQYAGQPSPTSGGSGGLADSPWPMFRQNLNHTGISPYNTSSNPGKLKWSYTTGGTIKTSPAISSDGTIYITSWDRKLHAFNTDGTKKWSFTTGDYIEWSSPAIDSDSVVYVGSYDGKLYAINPDGTEKWSRFLSYSSVSSPPTIDTDGTIYIHAGNNFYAINPNGTEKWNFKNCGGTSAAAIGADGTIYISSTNYKLFALNPNGTEKWNFMTGNEIDSSPAIGSDGTIYVGSSDHKFYAINLDGTEKWNFTTGSGIDSSPAIGSDGTIYFGSRDYKLYAINPNGTEKWSFLTGDFIHYSSPAISSDGTIYIGSSDDNLYAINPDGTKKWSFKAGRGIISSPAIGSDGTIYVGGWDHKLYAIGIPNLEVDITSHFTSLNSAAQSAITVHVTDGTNPVQGATVNLDSDNGGIFSPLSGITDANGDFKSIFNAPTVTTQIICRISAEVNKNGYNNGSDYVDVTINPIPWPMFGHNCRRTGLSPYDTSSNPGKLKWSYTTGGAVRSPVIGSDGSIYVASNDKKLYAINPNGTQKWNFMVDGYIANSPTIGSDGTIYTGSGSKNKLYALNPDGIEIWNFTANGRVSSPAIGSDGTIYFSTSSSPGPNPLLYAINSDGTEKWRFTIGMNGRGYMPAIASDGTIYVGTGEGKLYAVYSNGIEKWNFSAKGYISGSPTINSNGTIYVGSDDNNLYAINPDGTEKWNFTAGSSVDSPAFGVDGTIYVGSNDHKLYAINPDGTEKWTFITNGLIQTTPAIGSDGTIFIGSDDRKLHAINPDGNEKWNFTTGWMLHSSPAIGSDGTIYVGSWDNKLYAIGEGGVPPIANAGPDQTINEGDSVSFNASTSHDPDGTIETYEWDFDASDGLWWETSAAPDATGPTAFYIYGDDGIYIVTLKVTDNDNLSTTDTCNVTVQNINPTVTIESISMEVEIGLRVAGRKYNNVSMTLFEDGNCIGYVLIERMPGSPDEQMAWIPVSINFSKSYNATVTYTPKDPPNVGGNPIWMYIKSQNGSINKIHHTFNVQQSKKRDSDHWNHVEPWEVNLNGHFIGLPFEITSHITDPGSDDEILTFTYGSQVKTVTYLNNPPNLDPYPSPEVNPRDIMDTIILIYEGSGTLTLVVKDDDNIRLGIGEEIDSIWVA